MPVQVCTRCRKTKENIEFQVKKDGSLSKMCLECLKKNKLKNKQNYENNKEKRLQGMKEYQEKNKDRIAAYQKCYRAENSERLKEYDRNRYQDEERRNQCIQRHAKWRENSGEHVRQYRKEYRDKNRDKINQYVVNRLSLDPLFKLAHNARTIIRSSLKGKKLKRSLEYLGCSIEEYKNHIDEKLLPEMNWDNYGALWHIDHIIPIFYDKPTMEQVIERLHFKNTQPLLAIENLKKGNRYVG